jgi:hypothetical protein
LVVATSALRLGLETLINRTVRLVDRVGGARPGRKILTLVHMIESPWALEVDGADSNSRSPTGPAPLVTAITGIPVSPTHPAERYASPK